MRMKRRLIHVWALCALAGGMFASAAPAAESVSPAGVRWDSVVAEVNDRKITRAELAEALLKSFGRQWLRSMIEQETVRLEAKSKGVAATMEEVEAAIEEQVETRVAHQARVAGMNVEEFAARLKQEGRDIAELRRGIRHSVERYMAAEVLAQKLLRVQIALPEKRVRAEYDLRYGPKVRVRHIEVATAEKARQVLNDLKDGADFNALAGQLTLDKSSRKSNFEMTPPPSAESRIGKQALALQPGERGIVKEGDRHHVIEFAGRVAGGDEPFEKVAPHIRQQLVRQEIDAKRADWLKDLRERHKAVEQFTEPTGAWDDVVAQVGDRSIRRSELAEALIETFGRNNVKVVVLRELVRAEAERLKVSVSEDEYLQHINTAVDRRIAEEMQALGISDVKAYAEHARKRGVSLEERRKELAEEGGPFLHAELLARRCLERTLKVSDREIEQEFLRRYDAKVQARQIVTTSEMALERAEKALEKGQEFDNVARELSADRATAGAGGLFETRNEGTLGRALFEMKRGERRRIHIGRNWHLVEKLQDIPAQKASIEDARAEIRRDLVEQKIAGEQALWLLDLEAAARIRIHMP